MLQQGRFNVVVDGQWGSCGKGLINTAVADRYRPQIVSSTNMPNAGHTCIDADGKRKFVAKCLPTSAVLAKWRDDYNPLVVVGPTAVIDPETLKSEAKQCGLEQDFDISQLKIHPRAAILSDRHREEERSGDRSTKHIASTMQGCGACLAEKIQRLPTVVLADCLPCSSSTVANHYVSNMAESGYLNTRLRAGYTMLHEGSQGFSLGINHGSHYPNCTSRECTSTQMLADMGIRPQLLGEVIMVIRPYPIRVGNVVEGDKTVGFSGDGYHDHEETTWEAVAEAAGAPTEVTKGELTTVTKRLRRVFTFSKYQLARAAEVNGATQIALNFANYVDFATYGVNDFNRLTDRVYDFIDMVEKVSNVPVTIVGTGPNNDHVCFR